MRLPSGGASSHAAGEHKLTRTQPSQPPVARWRPQDSMLNPIRWLVAPVGRCMLHTTCRTAAAGITSNMHTKHWAFKKATQIALPQQQQHSVSS